MNPYKTDKINLADVKEKIRLEDYRYGNLAGRSQILYWVFVCMYSIYTIIHIFDGSEISEVISSSCYLLGMLIFALSFKNYSKEYHQVDYSLSTLVVLKKAADRYKPFRKKTWWLVLAVCLIDAGISLTVESIDSLILAQSTVIGGTLVGITVGLVIWYKRYKPLRDEALLLIRQIEEE